MTTLQRRRRIILSCLICSLTLRRLIHIPFYWRESSNIPNGPQVCAETHEENLLPVLNTLEQTEHAAPHGSVLHVTDG